jgi:hypothetical protein
MGFEQRQGSLDCHLGVCSSQSGWRLEGPSLRDAKLAQRSEASTDENLGRRGHVLFDHHNVAVDERLRSESGTDVLPTCSMATQATPAASIAAAYSWPSPSNRPGHAGS